MTAPPSTEGFWKLGRGTFLCHSVLSGFAFQDHHTQPSPAPKSSARGKLKHVAGQACSLKALSHRGKGPMGAEGQVYGIVLFPPKLLPLTCATNTTFLRFHSCLSHEQKLGVGEGCGAQGTLCRCMQLLLMSRMAGVSITSHCPLPAVSSFLKCVLPSSGRSSLPWCSAHLEQSVPSKAPWPSISFRVQNSPASSARW